MAEFESLFQNLFSLSPIPFQIFKSDRSSLMVNDAYRRFFGDTFANGQTLLDAHLREDPSRARLIDQAFRGETVVLPALWLTPERRAGFDTQLFRLPVEGGYYVAAVARDLTVEMKAQARLRESQWLLEKAQAVGQMGSWISTTERAGELLWSNEVCRIFGLKPEEFDSRLETFFKMVHPDDLAEVQAVGFSAIQTGRPYDLDHRIVRKNGEIRWVRERAEVLPAADGLPARLIGIVQDITETKSLEERFHQAQKMDAVGRLAGGIAHDFNNVLGVILLHAEHGQYKATDSCREEFEYIRAAAERAAGLTRQLLTFSRKQVVEHKPVDLNAVLTDLDIFLRRLLGDKVSLEVELKSVPPVLADRAQMDQIIMNLVVNAKDAVKKQGSIRITTDVVDWSAIRISEEGLGLNPGEYVVLEVRDTGEGMSEAVLERAFEPFFTTKELGKGTGLGLATVFGIAKQSGGEVKITSRVGEGTCVRVFLPALDLLRLQSGMEQAARARALAGVKRTVLLVEDEEALREITSEVLRDRGFEVHVAESGREALDVIARVPELRLVITDVMMPEMTGAELVARIRAEYPARPWKFLFVSGYPSDELSKTEVEHSGEPLLMKPYSVSVLLEKITELLA